jgi:hypothetical protein
MEPFARLSLASEYLRQLERLGDQERRVDEMESHYQGDGLVTRQDARVLLDILHETIVLQQQGLTLALALLCPEDEVTPPRQQ